MIYLLSVVSCFAGVVALIYFSDRTDKPALKWIGIFVPPLIALGLYRIPFDMVTSLMWLPAWVLMVYSALRISYILLKNTYNFYKSRDRSKFWKGFVVFIRPGLYITAYFIARTLVGMSVVSANAKAIELSFDMKEYVLINKICRDKIPEWDPPPAHDPGQISFRYGEYGTKYPISYECDLDNKEFRYRVRVNFDSVFQVKTSFDGQMIAEYGHYSNRKIIEIDATTDLESLSKMKIHKKSET